MGLKELYPSGFMQACKQTLSYLYGRYPMDLWMISRTNGEEWTLLEVIDDYYGVKAMDEFKWSTSFGYRMVLGLGPKVAPRVREIPAYVSAPASQQATIESYVGIPLELQNGKLFGLISAISPTPRTDELYDILPEIENYSKFLMNLFHSEQQVARLESTIVHMESPHWVDPQSGALLNGAWVYDSVDADWARVNHLEPAGVAYMDFADAPAEQLMSLVEKVKDICEDDGSVYRDGENHFYILFRSIEKEAQQAKVQKIRKALSSVIQGSHCAFFYRSPKSSTASAFQEAKKHCLSPSALKSAA